MPTLFEIFIFCPNIQLWFPEKIVDFLGWKTRENVVVLDILAVDNFDFTRKIVKKNLGWKTRENVGVLSKLNFWTKFDFSKCEIVFDKSSINNWRKLGVNIPYPYQLQLDCNFGAKIQIFHTNHTKQEYFFFIFQTKYRNFNRGLRSEMQAVCLNRKVTIFAPKVIFMLHW